MSENEQAPFPYLLGHAVEVAWELEALLRKNSTSSPELVSSKRRQLSEALEALEAHPHWELATGPGFGPNPQESHAGPTSVEDVVASREAVYGPNSVGFRAIGLVWTGLLEKHYRCKLPKPVPGFLVAVMETGAKLIRAANGLFDPDHYQDTMGYASIAERLHRAEPDQRCVLFPEVDWDPDSEHGDSLSARLPAVPTDPEDASIERKGGAA